MLVLKLELWRRGDPRDRTELGCLFVAEDGTSGDPKIGSYGAVLIDGGRRELGTFALKGWPRLDFDAWHLMAQFLQARSWQVPGAPTRGAREPAEDDDAARQVIDRTRRWLRSEDPTR